MKLHTLWVIKNVCVVQQVIQTRLEEVTIKEEAKKRLSRLNKLLRLGDYIVMSQESTKEALTITHKAATENVKDKT
ncbi:unnamed protein product [Arabis nemorensis]|uniref:Uncharacterized protein n=1 Tax=Arabis nemorensis TaxID=586526 RepID=A0A565BFS1_9BRAS|nr:unnamed protein product [Arabis nemorensis]